MFFFTPGYLGKVTSSNISSCIGFYVGKTFEFSDNKSDYVALVPFELEHLDAWGLAPLVCMEEIYAEMFIDDYSRYAF